MKLIRRQVQQYFSATIALGLVALALVIPGCGGGSSGTGGGVQIAGSLRSNVGAPIPGVTVTASAVAPVRVGSVDGSTTITDATGAFTVSVDLGDNEVPELRFEGSGINTNYVVSTLPPGTSIINIDLEYDEETDEINEDSVSFEDENGNDVED